MSPRAANQDFDIVQIDPAADAEAVAQAFRGRPEVEYAQAAYRVHAHFVPNDRFYSNQWNLPAINMETGWDIQPAAGSTITVAVLDTGIAFTTATVQYNAGAFTIDSEGNVGPPGSGGTFYPALGNLSLQFVAATELGPSTRFVAPRDFIWNDALPLDLNGHGTHVSGTVGQLTNNAASGLGDAANGGGTAGVAFNVKLMPVKVLSTEWDDIFGSPNAGTDDIVALGIRYAADNGAQVINMSLGRTGPANCGVNPNQDGCAPAVEDAIRYAVAKGCLRRHRRRQRLRRRQSHGSAWRNWPRAFQAPSRSPPSTGTGDMRRIRHPGRISSWRRPAGSSGDSGRRAASFSRRSISTWSRPSLARRRSLARRASMRWRISTSSEPRSPRRTCPVLRRC